MNFEIALTGDAILLRRLNSRRDGAIVPLFDRIRAADVAFANLEVLPNDYLGDPALESGGSHFGAPAWVLDELAEAGFDLFAAATNHSLDYSISGLRHAMAAMDARQVRYAGIGRNLDEARMPVYCTTPRGTVAMLACTATFAAGQEAAAQTAIMPGRPGPSPLHVETTHVVTAGQMAALRAMAGQLGLEAMRRETIRLGFGFPPRDDAIFPFGAMQFTVGDMPRIVTAPDARDMAEIAHWVEEARLVSDRVIVSIHAHEAGYNPAGKIDPEIPAAFLRPFAHAMVEAGADIVVGHGPHLLRGLEMHRGRPIFYSLGNFIGQNELVARLPGDSYRRFRADPMLTPAKVYRLRTEGDRKGFPSDRRFWETVVPICRFDQEGLKAIEILPVTLGLGQPAHRRGTPALAEGAEAEHIAARFARLSAGLGTELTLADGRLYHHAVREGMHV